MIRSLILSLSLALLTSSTGSGQTLQPLSPGLSQQRTQLSNALKLLQNKEKDYFNAGEKLDREKDKLAKEENDLKQEKSALKNEQDQVKQKQQNHESTGQVISSDLTALNREAEGLLKRKQSIEGRLKDNSVNSVRLREDLRQVQRAIDDLVRRSQRTLNREADYQRVKMGLDRLLGELHHRYEDHEGSWNHFNRRQQQYEERRFQYVRKGMHLAQERKELENKIKDYHRRVEAFYGKSTSSVPDNGTAQQQWRIDFDDDRRGPNESAERYQRRMQYRKTIRNR